MSVVTLFQSDRDPSKTFADKKEADSYDKQLELAESLGVWMKAKLPELSAKHATRLGALVAENKAELIMAFKGKVELLQQPTTAVEEPAEPAQEQDQAEA